MGHGDHWNACGMGDQDVVEEMLPDLCEKGRLIGENAFSHTLDDVANKAGTVFGLQYLDSPLHFLGLVVSGIEEGSALWSAYPVCAEGSRCRLVIDAIEAEANGIEGLIEASAPEGGLISFFDPYFFLNKDRYRVGEGATLRLAALAYMLRKTEQLEIQVDGGPMLELHRQRVLEEDPTADVSAITSVPISMDGAALYFSRGEPKDDAEIRFKVEEVSRFKCAKQSFLRLTGPIMKPNGEDVKVVVYAAEYVLDGYVPQVGDNIEAIVWMQGYLSPTQQNQL